VKNKVLMVPLYLHEAGLIHCCAAELTEDNKDPLEVCSMALDNDRGYLPSLIQIFAPYIFMLTKFIPGEKSLLYGTSRGSI